MGFWENCRETPSRIMVWWIIKKDELDLEVKEANQHLTRSF